MGNIFSNIAKQATTLSPIMNGRTRITIDEVISKYPDGVTIIGFDMINTGGDSYPVLVIDEDVSVFVFGGAIMNNIVHAWIEHYEGDIESANEDLVSFGGVKVKFEKTRTKAGNNLTKPIIID